MPPTTPRPTTQSTRSTQTPRGPRRGRAAVAALGVALLVAGLGLLGGPEAALAATGSDGIAGHAAVVRLPGKVCVGCW